MLHIEQLSFWERDLYFSSIDFIVIGAGIVGCSAALGIRKLYPNSKILVLERGYLPSGASTKNAGFACFGSASELLSDIKKTSESSVWDTVAMRWEGLKELFANCDRNLIHYQKTGSYDLFTSKENETHSNCLASISHFNEELFKITGTKNIFSNRKPALEFGFSGIENAIFNSEEGMIDTGKMMQSFHQKLVLADIKLLCGIQIMAFEDKHNAVHLKTNIGEIISSKLCIATNGFATELIHDLDVKPARAQVLITKPINNLKFEGTFHYNEGYYYFRNIGNRVLLGGGRNLDFEKETTTEFQNTEKIKTALNDLMKNVILPHTDFEIDYYWSGIMGVGSEKKPIIKKVSKNVFVGVRMGGMGVAIGSLVGKKLAEKICNLNI